MEKGKAEELKEMITVFAEKVPALLNSLTDVLYGKEQAAKYGQAVAGFYKALKDSGMTDEQAFELTKQYMSPMNLGGLIGKAMRREGGGPGLAFKIKKGDRAAEDDEDDEE